MSRIGKQPVAIPAGVKVTISGRTLTIGGPVGTLTMEHHPEVRVAWKESEKSIVATIDEKHKDNAEVKAVWGTTRALIRNMVEGVTKGYEKSLEIVGVGWTAAVAGKNVKLVVGYA